jgi:uncharacterized delta-60 repeat protein
MRNLLKLLICIQLSVSSIAQVGSIDPNFNLGSGFGPGVWEGKCEVIVQQEDGKLLIGGSYKEYNGVTSRYLTRLNLDGSIDNDFTADISEGWGNSVLAIAIQTDGKIVIGGEFTEVNGVVRNRIARLNPDGSLDVSFDPASGFNLSVEKLAIQTDGKILVAGGFTVYDYVWGGTQTNIDGFVRLNTNGTLDSSFDPQLAFPQVTDINYVQASTFVAQENGKILAAGIYSNLGPELSQNFIVRMNADGTRDESFDAGTHPGNSSDIYNGMVNELFVLPDGKIMVSGNYVGVVSGLDRLNSDGSLDETFLITPTINDHRSYPIAVQSDQKILAARVNFGPANEVFVLERYNTDGTLDASFPSRLLNNDVNDVIVQQDGNVVLVGYFNYNPTGIMRLIGDTPFNILHENYTASIDFQVFPIPTSNVVYFQCKEESYKDGFKVLIYSSNGQILFQTPFDNHVLTIDLSALSTGFYTYKIVSMHEFFQTGTLIID